VTTGALPDGPVESPTASGLPRVRLVDPALPESTAVETAVETAVGTADGTAAAAVDPNEADPTGPDSHAPESDAPESTPGEATGAAPTAPPTMPAAPSFPRIDADSAGADSVEFGFNLAKVPGQGEDSDPLLHRARDLGIVGVFDGMGGAGGRVYETADGPRTGAYLASRIVRDVVQRHLLDTLSAHWDLDGPQLAAELHDAIAAALGDALAGLHAPQSGLRSKLIRALPTTMAVAVVQRRAEGGREWSCDLFSAGDSRVYVFDPVLGAAQLTVDDIRGGADAMANLRADSVLSNAISADTPFVVHHRRVQLTAPFLLVGATDGAFGYLPSPMHFEHLVLTTLGNSADVEDWSAELQPRITAVTGDDAAMAVLGVGGDHQLLRDLFAARSHLLENDYVRPLDGASTDLQRLELEVEILRNRSAELSADLWSAYRPGYERHRADPSEVPGS
jgi:serine/threonine protein phosphatase PrpC